MVPADDEFWGWLNMATVLQQMLKAKQKVVEPPRDHLGDVSLRRTTCSNPSKNTIVEGFGYQAVLCELWAKPMDWGVV